MRDGVDRRQKRRMREQEEGKRGRVKRVPVPRSDKPFEKYISFAHLHLLWNNFLSTKGTPSARPDIISAKNRGIQFNNSFLSRKVQARSKLECESPTVFQNFQDVILTDLEAISKSNRSHLEIPRFCGLFFVYLPLTRFSDLFLLHSIPDSSDI